MLIPKHYQQFLIGAVVCSLFPFAVGANPQGGTVAAGQATIATSGATTSINQSTNRAVIDWRGFDIAPTETTHFYQPSSSAITLNRVNSTTASVIGGSVLANGNVIIVNPNGVFFGPTATVDVNGLIATTADIDTTKFMTGSLTFDKPGSSAATIENQGTITAQQAGLIGFVAPKVLNSGVISAKLGRVHLASGDTATVDLYGDGLLEVAVGDNVPDQLVRNTGLIQAPGGTIALTAAAGANMVRGVVQVSGELDAPSIGTKNGTIIIAAAGSNAVEGNVAANKNKKSGTSTVAINGILNASGRNVGEHGGSVTVTGDEIALLNGTLIDATGYSGLSGTTSGQLLSASRMGGAGGDIKIGGDYLGGGITPTASNLYVDSGALILNDSLYQGDAGRTIFWSDNTTQFFGNVYARAFGGKPFDAITWDATSGGNSGDGGFVETSGHGHLDAGGYVNLTSSSGTRGTYFLDPTDITIYGNVDPNFISTDATINLSANRQLWIDSSDMSAVTLTYNTLAATASGTIGSHTITVSNAASLAVGARIRLGGAGATAAASTIGGDTYTITAISGTTVTVSAPLTSTYAASGLYEGYVSAIADKSGNNNDAIQAVAANQPLWLSNAQNGLAVASFNGSTDYLNTGIVHFGATSSAFTTVNYGSHADMALMAGNSYNDGYLWYFTGGEVYNNWGAQFSNYGSYAPYTIGSAGIYTAQNLGGQVTNMYANGALSGTVTGAGDSVTSGVGSGGLVNNIGCIYTYGNCAFGAFQGSVSEILIYNTAVSSTAKELLEQYQSAKWGVALTPPGTGATEAAQATASNGYSVFSTRYLERLSQSANISLQATHNINLDFKGDTLNFATAGRSLTLTAGNQILTDSAGAITTNNGAISLSAANGIMLTNAFAFHSGTAATTLTTTNGNISVNNALALGGSTSFNAGNGTLTFGSTINGAYDLTAMADAFSFNDALGGTTPLAGVSLTSTNSLTLPSISASTITAQTTGAGADITIPSGEVLTASGTGTPMTLVTQHNFINNAGSSALSLTGGGGSRWLVYSTDPANDTIGSLNPNFRQFSCTYSSFCSLGAGNGLIYTTAQVLPTTPTPITPLLTPAEYMAATQSIINTGSFYWTSEVPMNSANNTKENNAMIEMSPDLQNLLRNSI